MRVQFSTLALLLGLVMLCAVATPSSAQEIDWELNLPPGEPAALAAGESARLEIVAYDGERLPLPGVEFEVEVTGSASIFNFGLPFVTDITGRIDFFVQALCVDDPTDILVTAYPTDLAPSGSQSQSFTALGGNDYVLYVVNPQVTAALGESFSIYCQLDDPCGDPQSDTIIVEHAYGSSSVVWTDSGEFRVDIDTSSAPAEGYEEVITIRTGRGPFAEVSVRVITGIEEANWMYLSTAIDHYESGINEAPWVDGNKDIYLVVELDQQVWFEDDGYTAVEFSVEYPDALMFTGLAMPQAPGAIYLGGCNAGHCSFTVASGNPVQVNPWGAAQISFTNFGAGDNLLFTLGPADNGGKTAPAWAYHDLVSPIIFEPKAPAQGSGADHKPTWQAGVVLLNYNPQTITPETLQELSERVQDPGHPLWMQGVGAPGESWGAVKAQYKR